MNPVRKWLIMFCLSASGGVIYLLPYLREVYYIPLQKALDLSNTQFGVMMSVFGVVAMLSYFPGGWLADKLSSRKLIAFSLAATGSAGLYFATFPSYFMSIVIHAFWGFSVTLTFWAALIKATRNWAPPSQQGRAFGILESGRGLAEVGSSTALLAVFAKLGSAALGLSWVIILFSILNILLGVLAWFVLEDNPGSEAERKPDPQKIGRHEIFALLKMPVVWQISLVILAAYSAYWGSYYFTPYATDVFKMSVVFGGALGVGKMWLKPFSALGAGFLADRIGPSRAVIWLFVVLIVSFGVLAFTPSDQNLVFVLIMNSAIASLAIFALRGIYFALFEEGGIPLALTGTATGIVSVIGYTPDVFMPLIGGVLLDKYSAVLGYRYYFLFIAGLCLLGLLAAKHIYKSSIIKLNQTGETLK